MVDPTGGAEVRTAVMSDNRFQLWQVSYEGKPAQQMTVTAPTALDAARDFALQRPNSGADCVVRVTPTATGGTAQSFIRERGVWRRKEGMIAATVSIRSKKSSRLTLARVGLTIALALGLLGVMAWTNPSKRDHFARALGFADAGMLYEMQDAIALAFGTQKTGFHYDFGNYFICSTLLLEKTRTVGILGKVFVLDSPRVSPMEGFLGLMGVPAKSTPSTPATIRDPKAARPLVLAFRELGLSEGWLRENPRDYPAEFVEIQNDDLGLITPLVGMRSDHSKIEALCRVLGMPRKPRSSHSAPPPVFMFDVNTARRLAPKTRDAGAARRLVLEFREFGLSEGWLLWEGAKDRPAHFCKIPTERLPDVLAPLGGIWGDIDKIDTFCRVLDMEWHGHAGTATSIIDVPNTVAEVSAGWPYQSPVAPAFDEDNSRLIRGDTIPDMGDFRYAAPVKR